ncbi:DUF4065 domain-containing protein [Desulfobacterales bacterium HSG2]|nr:DUF4065 domain-containing protein [Desulfobacterales bacterium HSG2]
MTDVSDVAAFILRECGPVPAMKLHRLVYYCQAWSLVWDDMPLFSQPIEAWANGPVVRELYESHRGTYLISELPGGSPEVLSEVQQETVRAVLDYYGDKPSQWLTDLTHIEDPWKTARSGLPDRVRGDRVIGLDTMAEYYGSLPAEAE